MARISFVHRRRYRPAEYWEHRANELIAAYDDPASWDTRGWMRAGVEEKSVPRILAEHRVNSVIVAGAGAGRQYAFLASPGISVAGFDLSPTLVSAARQRYPDIPTVVDDVIGAHTRHRPVDAVVTTAVLQHIPPARIADATYSVQQLARRVVVIRETTVLAFRSSYQWAHPYDDLFTGWTEVHRETTDQTDRVRVELIAWRRRAAISGAGS